jgi:hypothetical protein
MDVNQHCTDAHIAHVPIGLAMPSQIRSCKCPALLVEALGKVSGLLTPAIGSETVHEDRHWRCGLRRIPLETYELISDDWNAVSFCAHEIDLDDVTADLMARLSYRNRARRR